MEILVTGDAQRWEEFRSGKNTAGHTVMYESELQLLRGDTDLIIDLSLDERPENFMLYAMKPDIPVLGCLVKSSPEIWEAYAHITACNFLPGFISMPRVEVALNTNGDSQQLAGIMEQLSWTYETVQPAAGMVTPRVVCMIINEAYYTAAEGTASREDIDTSMKLGTNYPYGPFEWSRKIGIRNVYEVLRAVYSETGNERYLVCPLLEEEYLALP